MLRKRLFHSRALQLRGACHERAGLRRAPVVGGSLFSVCGAYLPWWDALGRLVRLPAAYARDPSGRLPWWVRACGPITCLFPVSRARGRLVGAFQDGAQRCARRVRSLSR